MLLEGQLCCCVPGFLKGERASASDKSLCLEPDTKATRSASEAATFISRYVWVGHNLGDSNQAAWKSRRFLSPSNPTPPSTRKSQEETGHSPHGGPPSELSVFRSDVQERRPPRGRSPRENRGQMRCRGRGATPPNNPVSLLRRLQRAFTARRATHSNVESPSSRLRIPNSTRREPAPAVHVSLLLSGGTPVFRFT